MTWREMRRLGIRVMGLVLLVQIPFERSPFRVWLGKAIFGYNTVSQNGETFAHVVFKKRVPSDRLPESAWPILMWEINVPTRNLDVKVVGTPSDANGWGALRVGSVFDTDTDTMRSRASVAQGNNARRPDFFLNIDNVVVTGTMFKWDNCVTTEESREYGLREHPNLDTTYPCESPNCSIDMNYHGRHVEITLARKLYAEPDKYCSLVRDLLDHWTTKIDAFDANGETTK
jgi:hypothetical protein